MRKSVIDKVELHRLLKEGKSQREIAKIFGVSSPAITQAKKVLGIEVVKSVGMEAAHKIVEHNLDAVAQLQTINERANALLDLAQKTKDHDLSLRCMTEIRGQLKLQLEIFSALYDIKEVQQFQESVLEIIGEVDKDVREKIIDRLKERSAIRQALTIG